MNPPPRNLALILSILALAVAVFQLVLVLKALGIL